MDQNNCGSVIFMNSPQYNEARQVFNRSIQKLPASIAYCTNEGDTAAAIYAARHSGRTLRVRSGGHSYEGFSVGTCADVIDVSCMDSVSINEQAGTLTAGPGVTNRVLYETLGAYGYPFPSGTCPTVRVSGLTLGGGWGLSARMFGLTCDSLLSATLIDAQGCRHIASEEEDRELFFALRGGGGGNFGVTTSLTYRLPPRLFDVTYVELNASNVSKEAAAEFIRRFQQWLLTEDCRFTPIGRIFHSPEEPRGLTFWGVYYGGEAEARASLEPFVSLGMSGIFEEMTFLQAIRIVESGYPPYEWFTNGGRFSYMPFSEQEALKIVSLLDCIAEGSIRAAVSLYGLGCAVSEKKPTETAFFYRDALNIIALSTDWEKPSAKPANLAWFSPRYRALQELTLGSYVNFPNLENVDYMRAYYGGNAERLRAVQARTNPGHLLDFPQSIR
ncbi:MAG: FAD-binding oxidoreductase [Oscillospiraceae bacterium]|jgi:hypothetical protein|nr:FAD-binding oxidoreductase [Oscillospiraceae bacterium]